MNRSSLSLLAASTLALGASACSTLFPSNSENTGPTTSNGCATTGTKHVAPGGYYVNGNTICIGTTGQPHQFHGVDRPSLEWSAEGQNLSASDFQLMASWKANVVRIALNQDFWLADSPSANPDYPATVDAAVKWAEQAGMDVILDLHWSDAGTLGSCATSCQQLMADMNSITFWSEVAATYKNDGRVMFELYNEPHDIPWNVWKSGGMTSGGWMAAGMQQLYDAVRGAGADNLVIIGGVSYAYDLSGVPKNRVSGYNIAYATHPYGGSAEKGPNTWESNFGFLAATDPVVMTEFGDGQDCSGQSYTPAINTYVSSLLAYADQHQVNWTAWAWFNGGCTFPSLISDWLLGTPTPPGMLVQSALAGYNDAAPGGKRPGGTGAGGAAGAAGDGSAGAGGGAQDGGADARGGQGGAGGGDASSGG